MALGGIMPKECLTMAACCTSQELVFSGDYRKELNDCFSGNLRMLSVFLGQIRLLAKW